MPFKFWKREKREKEKGEPAEQEVAPSEEKPSPVGEAKEVSAAAEGPQPTEAGEGARPEAARRELEAVVDAVHGGLVELGLAVPGTRSVFGKKLAAYPGGTDAFLSTYERAPYRAVTRVLIDWLGFRVPQDFEPAKLLEDVNLRLSSFNLAVAMSDLMWLDQDLGLRKARLRLGDQEKVVRFKDARDFVKGINELLAPRKLAFLELETWSEDFAFLLTRDPRWGELASTDLVVVKAQETAVGAECGECGAPVGAHWHDCLACGAVFSAD